MKTQTVYVPVSVGERLPEEDGSYFFCYADMSGCTCTYSAKFKEWSDGTEIYDETSLDKNYSFSFWLEPQQLITFTPDDLEKFSIGLINAMADELKNNKENFSSENVYNTYINNL